MFVSPYKAAFTSTFDQHFLCFRYGFVEFEDNRDADDAVYELNGKELCGERVIVEHARGPRRDRDFYGGGYGGGGRSKSSLLPFLFLFGWSADVDQKVL